MIKNVTSFGRSGLQDFVVQRITGVILASYMLFWVGYVFFMPIELTFESWHEIFSSMFVRVFSILCLISLSLHAWIGIWTVLTDYIKNTALRFVLQTLVICSLFVFFIWGVFILWGFN